jgi:membrane protein insertase Oxa1/YidC/SpoIIIJ
MTSKVQKNGNYYPKLVKTIYFNHIKIAILTVVSMFLLYALTSLLFLGYEALLKPITSQIDISHYMTYCHVSLPLVLAVICSTIVIAVVMFTLSILGKNNALKTTIDVEMSSNMLYLIFLVRFLVTFFALYFAFV